MKAIKNGKGTDERLENLEARFKQICELQKALATEKPLIKSTRKNKAEFLIQIKQFNQIIYF